MANLLKDTFDPIHLKLTSGTMINLLASVSELNTIVFNYHSTDISVSFEMAATSVNYNAIKRHLDLGRYSQALEHAAGHKILYGHTLRLDSRTAPLLKA